MKKNFFSLTKRKVNCIKMLGNQTKSTRLPRSVPLSRELCPSWRKQNTCCCWHCPGHEHERSSQPVGRVCGRDWKGGCPLPAFLPSGGSEAEPKPWHASTELSPHFTLFRVVLLETDGAPEVLAALRVFTWCLAEALGRENKQVRRTVNRLLSPLRVQDFPWAFGNHLKASLP